MAVLITAKVKGQTQQGYDSVLLMVQESAKKAPGFVVHSAYPHPEEDCWIVNEIWNSKAESDKWFGENVVPNLPKGIHPKRNYQELHSLVTP